jgi:CheY-like chemotaxis protein
MTFQPKRPSITPTPGAQHSVRPTPAGTPSTRPSTIRDANAAAHAIGGGAVVRASATAARPTGRKTIMLVDADAGLRARLRALLELHYDVIEAKDGMEAVEMTSGIQPPAMIVSDTAMPRLDGFTLAKILRSNPVMRRVPIMFVSAEDTPQHVTQALVIGVSQYVPKKTPLAQIAEKIRKIVQ